MRYQKWQNERWDKMFQRLVAYKKECKSTSVPKGYTKDPKLAMWVHTQRTQCTNQEVSVERKTRLDSIGFVWKHNYLVPWEEMYQRLVASKKLSIERINYLDSIGFVWDALDSKWMEMYSKLVEYKKQKKSTRVPHYFTEDLSFGMWVYNQRFAYNKDNLSRKRLKLLNSISFAAS
ncbi:hypothetical protein FRACYDRAFT_250780 [Fragilariopsis cylindrus CCMP1102]|uniref:Helicase-associated domain-containing protein n=1 Tax=Fragilariopsis cylindrus CCMP1102 TaxID=635003 RepID=A0A1E7EPH6_9STRA|nr:hypothetical protein FRACYDRAFT_250780 [Fragilariopsis cylindrus CCMP1102]|eukprot:OEU07754.1 hypothetical protein FRACYDRAFT_250780 [Fragilariopsis cylindrus CCMP1102]